MKINEVAKKTGLTKKAIRYYEEKELIHVEVNEENGYKLYSEDNVEDLQVIAFLRNMDMPVMTIKEYLVSPKNRTEILNKHLGHIQKQLNQLDIVKDMIYKLMSNEKQDYTTLNNQLMNHQQSSSDYVLKQLAHLFPGVFGKYIVIHFGSFLNVPIDTKEKQEAFEAMVAYLDEAAPIVLPDEMREYLEEVDTGELIKHYTQVNENLLQLAQMNAKDAKEKLENDLKGYMEIIDAEGNNEYFKHFREQNESFRRNLEENGYYQKLVDNMRIISSSYDQYILNIQRLDKQLNLRYDTEGRILMDDIENNEEDLVQDPP